MKRNMPFNHVQNLLGALVLLVAFFWLSQGRAQEAINVEKSLLVQPEVSKINRLPSPQIDDFKTAEEIDLIRRALRHTSLSSRLDVFYNYFSGESRSFENFLASVQSQEDSSLSFSPTKSEAFATREKFLTLLKSDNTSGSPTQRLDVRMNRRLSFEYHNAFLSPHIYLDPLQRRVSLALVKTLPLDTTLSAYYDPFRKESLALLSHRINQKTEFRTFLFHSDKTHENNVLATIRFYF